MTKGRLEAFSDGVIAIIITVMVLELKVPAGVSLAALKPMIPTLTTYALSFTFLGIYWNNHHHMFHSVKRISGGVLWANLHLLFWLSLTPFVTAWLGESGFASGPVDAYGFVLLMSALAYYILTVTLLAVNGRTSSFARALGSDFKGKVSIVIYLIAIALSQWQRYAACALYGFVALMWLIPDRRFARTHEETES